jgi:hypothetical protein
VRCEFHHGRYSCRILALILSISFVTCDLSSPLWSYNYSADVPSSRIGIHHYVKLVLSLWERVRVCIAYYTPEYGRLSAVMQNTTLRQEQEKMTQSRDAAGMRCMRLWAEGMQRSFSLLFSCWGLHPRLHVSWISDCIEYQLYIFFPSFPPCSLSLPFSSPSLLSSFCPSFFFSLSFSLSLNK